MDIIKEILIKSVVIVILGLIYYFFTKESYFSNGIVGFIVMVITYIIAELVYNFIKKKL